MAATGDGNFASSSAVDTSVSLAGPGLGRVLPGAFGDDNEPTLVSRQSRPEHSALRRRRRSTASDTDKPSSGPQEAPEAPEDAESAGTPREMLQEDQKDSLWSCHICLDEASDPVVTLCGHLMCWTDLLAWWDSNVNRPPTCPVCKAPSGEAQVVPVYGRGRVERDPRTKPRKPRPQPQPAPAVRMRPVHRGLTGLFGNGGDTNGFRFHAGVFPLPGLGFSWTAGGPPVTDDGARANGGQRIQIQQPPPGMVMLQFFAFLFMMALFRCTSGDLILPKDIF